MSIDHRPYSTHITIQPGADCPFTVNFYQDEEYTGDACGADSLAEAMFISDLWATTGEVDWWEVYNWAYQQQSEEEQ